MSIRLVVAKYNEDISWINKIKNHKITVYDKSENPLKYTIKLPNVGREGHTFLYHIVENYDNLDDITVFLQGNPFEHIQVIMGWQYFGLPNAPYPKPLTSEQLNNMCYKIDNEIHKDTELSAFYQVIYNVPFYTNSGNVNKHLSEILNDNLNNESYTSIPGGQLIVPKKYILNRTKEVWKKALDLLSENEKWRGYSHEISWFYLFTNTIGNFGNHDAEKYKLDTLKNYGFHHSPNSWKKLICDK